jgi:hypothetical protein
MAIAVAIVTVKAETARDVGPGHKADHAAGDEANRTAHKRPRGRAERAVEHPLPGTCCSRRQQRHGNDCDRNNLSHDLPPMMLAAIPCTPLPPPSSRKRREGVYRPSLGERSPPPFVRLIKQPPARLKLCKRLLEPVEIFRRDAVRRRRSDGS